MGQRRRERVRVWLEVVILVRIGSGGPIARNKGGSGLQVLQFLGWVCWVRIGDCTPRGESERGSSGLDGAHGSKITHAGGAGAERSANERG